MEGGSLLDTLFEDAEDVEMLDVEEGELIEESSNSKEGESSAVGENQANREPNKPNSRRKKKNKNKKKRKRGNDTDPNVTDINRFVLDACKRLRERKSYLMYTAVGCLGVAALSDIIKEACGGQKTADGKRFRNGGGILWNIIKVRDPNAYKEIMSKGRDFEKQFKLHSQSNQEPKQQTEAISNSISPPANTMNDNPNPSDSMGLMPHDQSQHEPDPSTAVKKRVSVHDRIRVPVSYDDLLGEDLPKDELPRPE